VLQQASEHYAVSLHGVGLALGSAAGLDPWHLDRLERLVQRIEPARVSDHASFARVVQPGGRVVHGSDLLPIAFTEAALDILCSNVTQVQERLRRPILVENLSAYLAYADDAIAEPEFLAAQRARRLPLLLDLNNLMVNALNEGCRRATATRLRRCAAAGRGRRIHLAGYARRRPGHRRPRQSRIRPAV
jgi:uncharacterized protein (UPF0276 family)